MGVDINGWIEIRRGSSAVWEGAIRLGAFSLRNYDMFSSLFGVRPFAPFTPAAPSRGLPLDISKSAGDEYLTWEDVSDESWVAWSEVEALDGSDEVLDTRPHRYEWVNGGHVYQDKASANDGDDLTEGAVWTDRGSVYRVEKISRRQALDASREWPLLFRLMENAASHYGGGNVRMVVWFDY